MGATLIGALNRQPTDLDVLSVQKFRFQIRKLPNTTYTVSSVKLPGLNMGFVKQSTPFAQLPIPGNGNLQFGELVLSFIVDENMANYFELVNWMVALGFPKDYTQYATVKHSDLNINPEFGGVWSDAILHILTNQSNYNINIMFKDAFPVSLSELNFDAQNTQADPQIATVSFQYARYEYETTNSDGGIVPQPNNG